VDAGSALVWAQMRVELAEAGRRVNINDLWIAASAVRHGLPVVTQDDDFTAVEGIAGLAVIRV
jgi:predicted nucleic acid-binding protein